MLVMDKGLLSITKEQKNLVPLLGIYLENFKNLISIAQVSFETIY